MNAAETPKRKSGPPRGAPAEHALRWAAAAAVALALVVTAAAQQARVYRAGGMWVEETSGSLPAAANLAVKMSIGNVSVQGGNRQQIDYTLTKRVAAATPAEAQRRFAQFHFSAAKPGETAALEGVVSGLPQSLNAELLVQVPRKMQLVKVTVINGGNESVSAIDGRVEVRTSAGNLRLDEIGGSAQATSGGGNFEVGKVGGDLVVNAGGGSVHVSSVRGNMTASTGGGNVSVGSVSGSVTVRTGGGSIDVKQCAGNFNAVTGGGIIRLGSAAGPVMANSAAGAIQLFGLARGANVVTGGGGIVAEFLSGGSTPSSLQTRNGDIVVYVGRNFRANVQAEIDMANGHRLRSDFPEIAVTDPGGPSGARTIRAAGNLNGGGPLLRISAMSGDIEFRRAQR